MADTILKISELDTLDTIPEGGILPVSVTDSETYGSKLSTVRNAMVFDTAYETTAAGIIATKREETFFVYTDDTKEYVKGWVNTGNSASMLVDGNGEQVEYGTSKLLRGIKKGYKDNTGAGEIGTLSGKNVEEELTDRISKEELADPDGFKLIGKCPDVATLRSISGKTDQKIILSSYYSNDKSKLGGGELTWIDDGLTADDGGIFFRVNSLGGWIRNVSNEIKAEWFGVVSGGKDVGPALQVAISYVAKNGGALLLPSGEINMGTTRVRVDWFSGIKAFSIIGNKSVIVPENVDPDPVIAADKFYQSEKSLFVFTADAIKYVDGYLPQIQLIDFEIDYRKQRNKGGPTFETMGDSCHPTPFSDGMYGVYISRCLRPVIRGCTIRNLYGDGVIVKRCADFEIRNNNFFDVSGNQILRSDGSTATDHRGTSVFSWGSTGIIDNNFAHNTRVYTVDVLVDGVNVNGSLCGYIGFFSEYAMNAPFAEGENYFAAPTYPWYNGSISSTYSNVNPDSMVVMTNNRVYGYVIGLKAEASADVAMIGNRVFNCYIPIDSVSCSTTIENNWVDQIPSYTCPQSGLRFYQAGIVLSDFGSTGTAGMMAVVRNNRIFVNGTIAPLGLYRSDAVVESNQIRIAGAAPMWKQVDSKNLRNVKVTNNIFRIITGAYVASVVTSMSRYYQFTLSGNRFINENAVSLGITLNGFSNGKSLVENNHFDGQSYLTIASKSSVKNNRFENSARLIVTSSGTDTGVTVVEENHFEGLTSMTQPRIAITAGDVRIRHNTFNLTFDTTRTITGLIAGTATCYNVDVSFNKVIESGTSENFALINTGTIHNLVFMHNYGSGGRGFFLGSPSYGPFQVEGNIGFAGGIATGNTTDPNKEPNLSPTYTPSLGSKVHYLRPVVSGPEGIVYTGSGWKTFGSISA